MNFRETYRDDLGTAFFDTDDFAQEHEIDGRKVTAVMLGVDILPARMADGRKNQLNPKETAVNREQKILFIRECDARGKYTANAMINVDGRQMFILDVKHLDGMFQLTVGIYRV